MPKPPSGAQEADASGASASPLPQADDGRTLASMNVEGMPWYTPEKPTPLNPDAEPLTGKNLWRYAFSAVGAGLLIVCAFGAAGAAFILFCVHVWFR